MAATVNNHSLVGEALKLLAAGLGPYVTGKLHHAVANGRYALSDADAVSEIAGDVAVMLRVMVMAWNDVFRDCLGQTERSLVSEIREIRNRWAHLESFNDDDLDRALDSVGRLLTAVAAANEAERVNRAKHRLRRKRYGAPPPKAASTDTVPTDTAPASMPEPPNAATAPPEAAPTDSAPASIPEPPNAAAPPPAAAPTDSAPASIPEPPNAATAPPEAVPTDSAPASIPEPPNAATLPPAAAPPTDSAPASMPESPNDATLPPAAAPTDSAPASIPEPPNAATAPPETAPTDSATASMPEPPNAATAPPEAAPDAAPVATGGVKSPEGDVPLPAAVHAGDNAPPLTPHTVAADVVDDYIQRGVDHRRQGSFGRAMAEFDLAIGISPTNADAWYHRALAWGHMGDHDRAIIDFSRAIALAPEYADAYNCRGYARFCLGEYGPAMDDFERAIGLNPDDALTQKNLALARHHWDGRTDDDTQQAARFTDLSSLASGHR